MSDTSTSPDRLPGELLLRIDGLCQRFESDWKAGRRPRLEDYLVAPDASEYRELLRELIMLDAGYPRQAGEAVSAADYAERFAGVEATWLDDEITSQTVASAKAGEIVLKPIKRTCTGQWPSK